MSRSAIFAIKIFAITFDDNYQNLHKSFLFFFIFAKVWPVQTKITDTQTDAHRNRQAHSCRRNVADVPNKIPKVLILKNKGKDGTCSIWLEWPWKWRSKSGVEERDFLHSTGNVRLHIVEYFRILATWKHKFTQKGCTHIHKARGRGGDHRQNLQTDLPKN